MGATDSEHVRPMLNPPHLGELIRESMEEVGWNVTETATHLGCERGTLSRLLNGKAGVSPNMALALEAIGWGTAEHWMRMQASYELAKVRRERTVLGGLEDGRIGPRKGWKGEGRQLVGNKRDTTKYRVVRDRKTVHVGITNNPDRREREHKREHGEKAQVVEEGRKTVRKGARKWEREQARKGRPAE